MTDAETTNVIAFEPRREPAPTLRCELRLEENCGLEMLLRNDAGDVVAVLEYSLTAMSPGGWDLGVLRASWDQWRGSSAVAS